MDCGPTCLRMIAKYHGRHVSIVELRKGSFINQEGTSFLGLSDAAEAIGFRTLAIKVPLSKLIKEVPLPCIIHWNQVHFAVVYEMTRKKVKVADPAVGMLSYSHEEFSKRWRAWGSNGESTGVALLIEPTPAFYESKDEGSPPSWNSISYLFSYLRTHRSFLAQLIIGLLAGSLLQLIFPFLTQAIVDIGINTRNINFIYLILAGQLMLTAGKTSVDFIRRWILLHLSTRINISIISDFLIKLMRLPLPFFDQKKIGDILRRIEDHTRIEHFLSSSSLNILFSFFNLIVFAIVLMVYNMPVFFIFCVGSVIYVVYIVLFLKKRKELDYKRFTQLSSNQGNLIELINGMQEIKLNNCERKKRWEWERIQAKIFKVQVGSTRLQQYQEGGSLFINESKNILITFMAARAVIMGDMTLGMMLAVQFIIGQLNAPIAEFVNFIREYQDAKISMERIGEIHTQPNEDKESSINLLVGPAVTLEASYLELRNVTFQYEGPESPKVLNSINLEIPKGKVTAIVGMSGSGKTTLLKLLLKFYPPVKGGIYLGELDLKNLNSSWWRSKCGVVMQDGYIFSGTLASNIALSMEDVDYSRVVQAAKIANLHGHILSLPFGYETKVTTTGGGLSQGQKQRLLIARAVYKDPEYLFFDEATSSLDANNEKVILTNMNEFFKGRTVVVIAHRLSTVKNADQIVVLDKGIVVEAGNHEELSKSGGHYFELVKNQLELGK